MERKLVSVRRIAEVNPHPNADLLELAVVDGWKCVVKKGEFKAGDLCLYCEIDTVLPVHPRYEFLRKSCYVNKDWIEGFRIKTVKLRGQLSQGLVLPFEVVGAQIYKPGDDFTEDIGAKKWDPPVPAQLAGQVKGMFPSFMPKSDQERVQNIVDEVFADLDREYEITQKYDGASMTAYNWNDEAGVCSRNLDLKINEENKDNTFVKIYSDVFMPKIDMFEGFAVQGEVMGPGIQNNELNLKRPEFFVYNVYDIKAGQWLAPVERMEFVQKLGLKHVPVLHVRTTLRNLGITNLEQILKFAEGDNGNGQQREGTVYKSMDGKFSFKAISNEWLMKNEQ